MFLRVFPRPAVALAKCGFLAFLFALDILTGSQAWRESEIRDQRSEVSVEQVNPTSDIRLPTSTSLPNGCEVLAAEACARLTKAGIWSRILIIRYEDKDEGHALCVFQPHWQICVYDDTGTYELDTNSRDPAAIANLLSIRCGRPIKSARFLK
jgi:hypothetical protein